MNLPLDELLTIRGLLFDKNEVQIRGADPVFSTRFKLGETSAAIMAAIGVAVSDLWEIRTGQRQKVSVRADHAAVALRSYLYMQVDNPEMIKAWESQRLRQLISTPHPTKDGRYFLPHMGLPHLAERILKILKCDFEMDAIVKAVSQWNALDLEEAVAEARGCGAMVRSEKEWLEHPQGRILEAQPVIEIEKIGASEPEGFPENTKTADRPLSGIRALDLTRILAGPTCGRTLAEHGADVLMVAAEHLPQSQFFVMDTGHGKRSCYLDLNKQDSADRLRELVRGADIFSQGYRPGVMAEKGLSPEEVAEIRPGIIYVSMNCYGYDGPFKERAGWEQLAQTVTGLADEQGADRPTLLPAAACDYTTGYLAAYGALLALGRREREGGSWHVKASLCQSGMFIQRQGRVDYAGDNLDIDPGELDKIRITSDTAYGEMKHLGPILRMSETSPRWTSPTVPLGTHQAEWL